MSSSMASQTGAAQSPSVDGSLEQLSPVPEAVDMGEGATDDGSRHSRPRLFRSYFRIIQYGAKNGGLFALILGLIAAMGSGVALPLMNIVFGRLVGDFTQYFIPGTGMTKEKFLAAVAKNTAFILYLFALKFGLTYIYKVCFRYVGLQASSTLRLKYIHALFDQPVSKLDEMAPGTVINAIISSSNTIQQSIADRLATLFQTVTLLITAYAIAFHYSWHLTLVVSSAILFIAICMSITTPILVRLLHGIHEAEDKHMSIATDVFSSVRTVFSLNAEEALTARYVNWVNEARNRGLKISVVGAVHLGLIFFGVYCSFSLAFWYGLRQFYYGHIDDVNTIITVFFSVLIAVMVMGQIAAPLMIISKAVGSTGSFFDIIDSGEKPHTGLKDPQVSSEEDIVLENVTFAYPSRPTVPVLRDFSARFQKGKTTALVGPSGSGKSTAMALIEGWYQLPKPNSGGIFVGGQSLDQIDLKWWRSQVGLVQQEPFLFNDTIYNNVCLGLLGSRWEDKANLVKWNLVVAACKEAYAHDFIQKLPSGYDTVVGEGGITLSGGQRQRLAIARSIVSKPSVLILDEATSSIDIHSERIVQAALDRVAKNCTTIVIAHRLSTIRKADHIVVMKQGANVEEGTHSELIAKRGLYKQLVDAQRIDTDSLGADQATNGLLEHVEEEHGAVGFSIQSWLFAKLLDTFRYMGQDLLDAADFWALMFFILALSMGACYSMIGYSSNSISMHVGSVARRDYFTNILQNPVPYFDKDENASGSVASRLSSDTKQLQELCGIPSTFPMISVLNVTGCMIIAFIYGWKLSAVGVVAVMPILATAAYLRVRYELQLESLNAEVYIDSSRFISEAVRAFRTVSALTMEDFIINRYTKLLGQQRIKATRKSLFSSVIFAFSESMEFLAMALSFWYGGQLLASREYDPVDFFVVFIAIIQAAGSAGIFFSFGPDIAQTRACVERILMEGADVQQPEGRESSAVAADGPVNLEFSRVSFQYASRTSPTLEDLNIRISGGQFVAFVGASGCGKSTLISLLEQFYEPTYGKIIFGGRDLRSMNVSSYRRRVALVSQEPKLFEGSIRDNLLLGLDLAAEDAEVEMVQSCRDAEIHDFIVSLPDGYGTELGINAQVSLSGGQKQRLCIARALMRSPSLLLLDEATSSLDSESERLIQNSLERLAGKRNMIIIAVAHRLATIQKADCIYVFREGTGKEGSRIVEQGTHQELLQKKELYFQMEAHNPIINKATQPKTHTLHSVSELDPISSPCDDPPNRRTGTGRAATDGHNSPLAGTEALKNILDREGYDKFGFVLFRTYYREGQLWEQFIERYNVILREELRFAQSAGDTDDLLRKVQMEIVSDDCMANKIPAHIALAYRIFSDIEPGLKTKMCLIVDKESMESIAVADPQSVPFVKAVDVVLGADAESAFPRVIKVAISSLLARFYPALANCDTVWEIAPGDDEVWVDWPSPPDDAVREQ
ncbi:P-loop containing nucleoside triphosphate hydrolase protein [Aspergillus granulosus]|uniref:P-loop containing nucleoside triphosphate hydrolase protein n=1 Tax=Aspergillus granulosus TaxID=176169 RepID=A0ABR4HM24_9EURO